MQTFLYIFGKKWIKFGKKLYFNQP